MVKGGALFVKGDVGPVLDPVSAVEVAGRAATRLDLQVERKVAVAENEGVVGFAVEHLPTMVVQPLALGDR